MIIDILFYFIDDSYTLNYNYPDFKYLNEIDERNVLIHLEINVY